MYRTSESQTETQMGQYRELVVVGVNCEGKRERTRTMGSETTLPAHNFTCSLWRCAWVSTLRRDCYRLRDREGETDHKREVLFNFGILADTW